MNNETVRTSGTMKLLDLYVNGFFKLCLNNMNEFTRKNKIKNNLNLFVESIYESIYKSLQLSAIKKLFLKFFVISSK
jgi:hypothetical protein